MRIAIVHEWLASYWGSERVLEGMLQVFPGADLFSPVDFVPAEERSFIQNKPITTSFIQKLPFARKRFRLYLPLMPIAVEQFDLSRYDLVISSSHSVAKGVLTGPDQLHICMCYTPMRYCWDLQHQYLSGSRTGRGLRGLLARYFLHRLRIWDARTANGVNHFIAISNYISRRIWKAYRREATVIYPPVNVEGFSLRLEKEDFYLTASRMVPYKRVDIIIQAFSLMPERKLVVIGDGPEFKKIRARATPNITFLGYQPAGVLKDHLERARAFVFAAEEDFGLLPVEAQACGTPVLAYGKGGVLESVIPGETGLFFSEQTPDSIIEAMARFESGEYHFDPRRIRENTLRFGPERFRKEFSELVEREWGNFSGREEGKPC